MTRVELMAYCLQKRGAELDQPFGPEVDVIKVMNKVFALIPVDADPPKISLKCDPMLAVMLRDTYPVVTPGYHLNKKHWNSIEVDGSVPQDELEEWIDHSYDLVVKSLTRAQRDALDKSD